MNHVYKNIPGFCEKDIFRLYKNVVERFQSGHFVELGSFLGRSTSVMIVEILNSKKNIKFDCIDIWEKQPNYEPSQSHEMWVELKDDFFESFKHNLEKYDLLKHVTPIKSNSIKAANLYADESLDFIFLDSNHEYEYVIEEIKQWYPKIKKGGIISGHDYRKNEPLCVKKAVDEYFDKVEVMGSCWVREK